jgi:hypothetical protein
MARKARGRAQGGRRLGHLLVKRGGQFYFIPSDAIGPPIPLTAAERDTLTQVLRSEEFRDSKLIDLELAIHIGPGSHLIRICRNN